MNIYDDFLSNSVHLIFYTSLDFYLRTFSKFFFRGRKVLSSYYAGELDRIELLYTSFISMVASKPMVRWA